MVLPDLAGGGRRRRLRDASQSAMTDRSQFRSGRTDAISAAGRIAHTNAGGSNAWPPLPESSGARRPWRPRGGRRGARFAARSARAIPLPYLFALQLRPVALTLHRGLPIVHHGHSIARAGPGARRTGGIRLVSNAALRLLGVIHVGGTTSQRSRKSPGTMV